MNDDWLDRIKWTADGLVPAIAQEAGTGQVLMMAWMNRESLRLTVQEGRAIYWSRSRSAAMALTASGFSKAFNVSDGFEGAVDERQHRGRKEGWKAAGLPWIQQ